MIGTWEIEWAYRYPEPLLHARLLADQNVTDVYLRIYGPQNNYPHYSIKENWDLLPSVVDAYHRCGIAVHGAFATCKNVENFPNYNDKITDIFNPDWQKYIFETIMEGAVFVDHVSLDFLRTEDFRNTELNHKTCQQILETIREKLARVYPNKKVSAVGKTWREPQNGNGRDVIAWAKEGLVDDILVLNYGNKEGEYGDDPDMAEMRRVDELTELSSKTLVSAYQRVDGKVVPSSRFNEIEQVVRNNYIAFPGWCFQEIKQ